MYKRQLYDDAQIKNLFYALFPLANQDRTVKEKHIVDIAGKKGCQGVICGHIHYPEKKMIGNVLYLNSGDWMESLSALTEDYNGNWDVYIEEKALATRQMEKETILHTELALRSIYLLFKAKGEAI